MSSERPVYLFVLPWSLRAIGGVNQVVTNLALQMQKTGNFDPLVLTADWSTPDPIFEEIHGVRTVRWLVRPYERGMSIKEMIGYFIWEQRFRKKFAKFCSEKNIKAINVHYPGGMAFTFERLLQSQGSRLPLLLSFHGTDVTNLGKLSIQHKSDWRSLIERVQGTVACSNHLAQRVQKALNADIACRIIYNGVDAEKFAERGMANAATGKNIILSVGKFDYNKGQDVLIEAFSRISGEFPNALLHLVGGDGANLNSLRTLAMTAGLAERIQFFVDIPPEEMPSYFSRASIFAFPSRQEGFGLVLLEAGAFSLPVVASRVGGIPEIIEDSVTGVLIEPDDPSALAHALRRLFSEPSAAQKLGDRLHQRVCESFSWVNTLQEYEALIEDNGRQTLPLPARQAFLPTHLSDEVEPTGMSV